MHYIVTLTFCFQVLKQDSSLFFLTFAVDSCLVSFFNHGEWMYYVYGSRGGQCDLPERWLWFPWEQQFTQMLNRGSGLGQVCPRMFQFYLSDLLFQILWKLRSDFQKVQEERLQWKEKYLDSCMQSSSQPTGLSDVCIISLLNIFPIQWNLYSRHHRVWEKEYAIGMCLLYKRLIY